MLGAKRKKGRPAKVLVSLKNVGMDTTMLRPQPPVSGPVARARPQPTWESARASVTTNTNAEIQAGEALLSLLQGDGNASSASAIRTTLKGIEAELESDAKAMDNDSKELDSDIMELGAESVHGSINSFDEDEDESAVEVPVWDIPFQVPTGPKTIDTLKITSDASWTSVQYHITDKMDIAMKRLDLSYKLSTETKDAPARLLNTLGHWLELKDRATAVHEELLQQKVPKAHSKKLKDFEVILFDLWPKEHGQEKVKGKAKTKGDHLSKKCKHGNDNSDSDRNSTHGPEEGRNGSNQAHWVLALQQKYTCQEHGGEYCKIGFGGVHNKLKSSDLSLWGLLLERGKADKDLEELPLAIGPLDARTSRSSSSSPPSHAPDMAPYNLPPGGVPYHYWAPPPPPPYYGHYPQTPRSEPRTSAQTPRTWESNPSSDLEEIEDPTLFPRVEEWLAKLEQGPLGQDGHVFMPHALPLRGQGYIRISQLADGLTVPEMLTHCPGLVEGTAKVILKQAAKEVAKIRKHEANEKHRAKRRRYH
ncbi:hypothetical protein JB92DRAFT_2950311 [Gautieria morchelliformis]|nr:hypothetical protein JB92DRAFT_2950311 [Gautieria morchelliformis]